MVFIKLWSPKEQIHEVAFSALIRRVTSDIRIGVQSSLPAFQHPPQFNKCSLPIGTVEILKAFVTKPGFIFQL